MKVLTTIIGIILIIIGALSLGYRGITYTKQDEIAKIGGVKVTATQDKTIFLPPVFGGVSLVAGIALVAIARMGNKS